MQIVLQTATTQRLLLALGRPQLHETNSASAALMLPPSQGAGGRGNLLAERFAGPPGISRTRRRRETARWVPQQQGPCGPSRGIAALEPDPASLEMGLPFASKMLVLSAV